MRVVDPAEILPPMQYSLYWLAIGVAILVAIVLWFLLVPRLARRRPKPPVVVAPPIPAPRPSPRAAWLARIGSIEKEVAAGELTVRQAHLRLSALLREFATTKTGIDASAMTLRELRAAGLDELASAVAQYYPIAFQAREATQLGRAAQLAREVVSSWK